MEKKQEIFNKVKKIIFIVSLIFFLGIGIGVRAASEGESLKFNIESDYDFWGRDEILATLVKITPQLYFYIDQKWWYDLNYFQQSQIRQNLSSLANEFSKIIYPGLTSAFGQEWKPGIDKDERITILIHSMIEEAGSYFRTTDEYPKAQLPESNEREMIYLNREYIDSYRAKIFLSHEFMHLITFNQKEKKYQVEEEVWLNEARAEYAPTFLGYDESFEESNLMPRLRAFLKSPSDSITEWQNKSEDYGIVNLFVQYLVDHYGKEILIDSLNSEKAGIESLNYALKKNGFTEDFSQIFTDWTVTMIVNNCSVGPKYCYKNQHLKNFRITPSVNFLPLEGVSTLATTNTTKDWAGNWYKFVGGKGSLKIEFIGDSKHLFKVPYILHDLSGNQKVDHFEISKNQKGEILVPQFSQEIISVTIIPSSQTKISGFSENSDSIAFFWSASTTEEKEILPKYLEKPISEMSKEEIAAKIAEIEELLVKLKEQLEKLMPLPPLPKISCQRFENNLFYGLTNSQEVSCLQEFLKWLGSDIYPEGLITGNFLELTRAAVIRFQEKYIADILKPLGLDKGTGFVGPATRVKINELLK